MVSIENQLLLVVLKFATVVVGFYIVYLGLKAYRKQGQAPLVWLGIGMIVLSLSVISEGIAYLGLGWSLDNSHLFEAIITFLGFLVLLYSLFAR